MDLKKCYCNILCKTILSMSVAWDSPHRDGGLDWRHSTSEFQKKVHNFSVKNSLKFVKKSQFCTFFELWWPISSSTGFSYSCRLKYSESGLARLGSPPEKNRMKFQVFQAIYIGPLWKNSEYSGKHPRLDEVANLLWREGENIKRRTKRPKLRQPLKQRRTRTWTEKTKLYF